MPPLLCLDFNDDNFKDCRGHEKKFNSSQRKKVSPCAQRKYYTN